jgi:hypothetical protein
MADALIDNQTAPTTPAASKSILWVDSTSKKLVTTDDSGVHRGQISAVNPASGTASLSLPAATDTYVTNSGIVIPGLGMQIGQFYFWNLWITKTAAGTGIAIVTARIGSAQTTSDTSVIAMTGVAQTATAYGSLITVGLAIRTASASGVAVGSVGGGGVALGVGTTATGVSGSIDFTSRAGQFIGLSINPGTGDAWTAEYVKGILFQ